MTTERRSFLASTGLALSARPLTEKEKLSRIASNSWPIRQLFKTRSTRPSPQSDEMKKKYGTLTMLDFPQFTKDTFPGVYQMDLFSGLFGDTTDESMYAKSEMTFNGNTRTVFEFDPSLPNARKWLDKMGAKQAASGTKCHHISNNAPRDLADPDPAKRRAGIDVAKKWLDGVAILGAKSMRVNSGGPRIAPGAIVTTDYPKADDLAKLLGYCIESLKELADHGGRVGVKVTLENHWGLTANPMNIRIMLDEVNHPYCEASPDFCNWEHEYHLYHGLAALAPYTHTTVHAKYWNRWKEQDVRRSVKIMTAARFQGVFALEYEDGPWDGVEGAKYLYKEVLAAL
ncbi:MAG: TIM barrel protein [Acidobacteria bacterium]|nr:TIM barrel protein [Acidobacteriota bacterium]